MSPIGDLLAQIEGNTSGTANNARVEATKRKATDESTEGGPRKTLRASPANHPPDMTLGPSNSSSSPTPPRPAVNDSKKSAPLARRPLSALRSVDRPSQTARRPVASKAATNPSAVSANGITVGSASRPSPAADPPPKQLKKGSYAELMARASRAQQMKAAGTIQHKPVEKGLVKKDNDTGRKLVTSAKSGGTIISKPAPPGGPKAGTVYKGTSGGAQAPPPPKGSASGKRVATAPAEPEKKVKKAAMASTGYQGTARPRPSPTTAVKDAGSTRSEPGNIAKSGKTTSRKPEPYAAFRSRPHGPKRYEQEDSDMDDFIVDDEDEEDMCGGHGQRYGYVSDESSDMEAGLDDVWEEDARAERIAREEDKKEEMILQRKAMEKARRFGRR